MREEELGIAGRTTQGTGMQWCCCCGGSCFWHLASKIFSKSVPTFCGYCSACNFGTETCNLPRPLTAASKLWLYDTRCLQDSQIREPSGLFSVGFFWLFPIVTTDKICNPPPTACCVVLCAAHFLRCDVLSWCDVLRLRQHCAHR